jgi:phosphate-selective porin OprO/OprP
MLAITIGAAAANGQQTALPTYSDTAIPGGNDQGPVMRAPAPEPRVEATPASMAAAPAVPDKTAAEIADLKKQVKALTDAAAAAKAKAAGTPTCNVSGLIQWDAAAFSTNAKTNAAFPEQVGGTGVAPNKAFVDGTEPRRLRLLAAGEYLNMDYKAELEFFSNYSSTASASTAPRFKDVYFTVRELPYIQNVRVGHFKEPFGLDQLTPDRFNTFMERSMTDDGAIVPARNIGIMSFGWTEGERATYAIGGFLNGNTIENPPSWPPLGRSGPPTNYMFDDKAQCALTMRATFLPWIDEATQGELNGSRGVWHCGFDYSYRADEGVHRPGVDEGIIYPDMQIRPEAHLSPIILQTNALAADHNQLLGFEQAVVYGPFSFQTEYFGDFIHQDDGTNVFFYGYYAGLSYFLTGENRPYNRKTGAFDRVRPYTNFFRVRTQDDGIQTGWGAWELAYRYSYASLFDEDLVRTERTLGLGRASDHTIGLNWYLNPYCRIMWNYVFTTFDRINTAGTVNTTPALTTDMRVNTFEMRAQFDW